MKWMVTMVTMVPVTLHYYVDGYHGYHGPCYTTLLGGWLPWLPWSLLHCISMWMVTMVTMVLVRLHYLGGWLPWLPWLPWSLLDCIIYTRRMVTMVPDTLHYYVDGYHGYHGYHGPCYTTLLGGSLPWLPWSLLHYIIRWMVTMVTMVLVTLHY